MIVSRRISRALLKKSPTIRLLFGLLITLCAVTSFSGYSLHVLSNLRKLQNDTVDLNRHDSLLLLGVQNDINTLGLKIQELTEKLPFASVARYDREFQRLRADLDDDLVADTRIAAGSHRSKARSELGKSLASFWQLWNQANREASAGHDQEADRLVTQDLSNQLIVLQSHLSRLLEENNETEARADAKVASIYDASERQTYLFLAATMAAILLTSLYMIHSNRRIFDRLENMSRQRRVLAARLISVQEEVLRSISRELHDEFGQILTAVGAMLARAEKKGLPPDSPFRTELSEVRQITHDTLEKMRSLSQTLHPSILDDYGLAKGIEWYTDVFQRQSGIQTVTRTKGEPVLITGSTATHCFRIVQESLTNAAKHAKTKSAEVTMVFERDTLTIHIRDFGSGMQLKKSAFKPGLGVIAMRERAEILRGEFTIESTPGVGTTVSLEISLRQEDQAAGLDAAEETGEVVTR